MRGILWIAFISLLLNGCLSRRGIYYRIKRGDSLKKIASDFETPEKSILAANEHLKPGNYSPGEIILIPSLNENHFKRGLLDILRKDSHSVTTLPDYMIDRTGKFEWPLKKYRISSLFGKRGRRMHRGIDLVARKGTPILAAESGVVIYSGNGVKGYGNLVIVRHSKEISTVYAHNQKNLVRKGELVKKGQKIALLGNTGNATGAHLHFEVRAGSVAKNPLKFLTGNKQKLISKDSGH